MKTLTGMALMIALSFATWDAATAANGLVYIPLGNAGEVVTVDAENDRVAGKIEGVPAIHGLAGTPNGRFLVAGSNQERVPDSEMPAKPSSVSEEEHAAHHGGAPAVAGKDEAAVSTVSIIRTSDGSIVRRIDVPGAVHHVAVGPGGRFAVVTHPNEGTVSVLDLSTYNVIATVGTGQFPNYAAFAPDGGRVYVSNAGDGSVSAIDAWNWTLAWTARVGESPEHVVVSADGGSLFVNNVDDGSVSVLSLDERKVVRTIPVGATIHGIDLSDDGRILFVTALGDDKLVAFDLATGAYRSTRLAPAPYHLAAVRGEGKVYVSSADEPKIWVVDQKSLSVLDEIRIGGKGHQMVVAPDS